MGAGGRAATGAGIGTAQTRQLGNRQGGKLPNKGEVSASDQYINPIGTRLVINQGKIMGAMPMTAKLSPAEFRKGFALLNLKLVIFLLTFPFRGWGKR